MKNRTRRWTHSSACHLLVERLEPRALLTGDFAVILEGETLFIRGDQKDNSLSIQGSPDCVTLTGTDTSINGSSDPAYFSNVRRIQVEGMAGEDVITAFFLDSDADQLLISTAEGHDEVSVWTNSGLDIGIDSGNGADRVDATSFSAHGGGGDILISTAAGDDELSLQLFEHQGNVVVDMGNGNDAIVATIHQATGDLSVDCGNGNDNATIRTQFSFFGQLRGNLSLRGGNGQRDSLFVQSSLRVDEETDILDWEPEF